MRVVLVIATFLGSVAPNGWDEFYEDLQELQWQLKVTQQAVESAGRAEEMRFKPDGSWREEECRYQTLDRGIWTEREERATAFCALEKWSVEGGWPKFSSVAACESNWWRLANNGGSYLGLFQHSAGYWRSRVHAYRPPNWRLAPSWTNSRSQIVVTARMVHQGGWSPWSCA